jgi:GABA(A) receptor-associated protein
MTTSLKTLFNFNDKDTQSCIIKEKSFEKRLEESERIKAKYPERIPIIITRGNDPSTPIIDKQKYLVPMDLTAGQIIYIIRKRITLNPDKALFIFVQHNNNSILPKTSEHIGNLYKNHKDDDGFLYITYTSENTFG